MPGRERKESRVRDLCKDLGYASDLKQSPRSMHSLSLKTAAFRKEFIKINCAPGYSFPLQYDSPVAQSCASRFLSKHAQQLFSDDSMMAQVSDWPIYPRDAQSLTDNLARLMCTQERLHQRNEIYLKSQDQRDPEENDESDGDESDSERSDSSDLSFSSVSSHIHSATKKGGTYKRKQKAQKRLSAIDVQKNIEIHLDFMFPLGGIISGGSYKWLFASGASWPEDVKRFAFRDLHERSLYTARQADIGEVASFTRALKTHLKVQCTRVEDQIIQTKCMRFISRNARLWCAYGFIEETKGLMRRTKKTAQFELAWTERRRTWVCLEHIGNPVGGAGNDDILRSREAEGGDISTGNKRTHVQSENAAMSSHSASSTAKKSKVNGPERDFTALRATVEDVPGSHTGNDHDAMETVDQSLCGVSEQGSKISMSAQLAIPALSLGRDNGLLIDLEQNVIDASALPTPSGKLSETDHRTRAPHPQPPSPPSSVQYAPSFARSASMGSVQVLPPSIPSKPKLLYILQNPSGALDHDCPLSGDVFRSSTICEFFSVVANRAGLPDRSLTQLTFVYNWGDRTAFVVNRRGGDEYWEDIKERVKGTFLHARRAMKKRTKFELWVMCGDTTNLDENEDEEDW